MKSSSFPLSQKYLDFINTVDGVDADFLEGITASGKTTVGAGVKFMRMVSRSSKKLHIIASKTTGTAEKNVIQQDNGILDIHPKYLMAKYKVPADHVIRHYDVTGKICPNPFAYNHTQHTWDAFKAALTTRPTEYTLGWNHDQNGWWFADSKSTYYKSCWMVISTVSTRMDTLLPVGRR